MSSSMVIILILLSEPQQSSGHWRLCLQGILMPRLIFLSASERQNRSLVGSEMGIQAALLPPNEKQSLWPESQSGDKGSSV